MEKPRDSQAKDTKAKKRERELNQKKTVTMPYLYCFVVYSKSKVGEGWMKCGEFDSWAHKSVQGITQGVHL